MLTPHDLATVITARVTVPEVIGRYLPAEPIRAGRIRCPFHGGKNQNLGFNAHVYHCFVCGARGDAIGFVRQLYGLSFHEAARKLDTDFALGLSLGDRPTLRQQRELSSRARQARTLRGLDDAIRQTRQAHYDRLLDEWIRLDEARRRYAPQTPDEPLDDRYVEAVLRIDAVGHELDVAFAAVREVDRG